MEVDEEKRITTFQLAKLPYFERILKKSSIPLSLQTDNYNHGTPKFSIKSPSFVGKDPISTITSNSIPF